MATSKPASIAARLMDLYFTENKPAGLKPVDLTLLSYLILRQTEDHYIYDSQETLAARLGCERKTVKRSIENLEKLGWITVKRKWDWNEKTHRKTRAIYAPLGLCLNPEKLPKRSKTDKRSAPSEDAIDLAAQHSDINLRYRLSPYNQGNRKQPKRWKAHQAYAAQKLIDAVGSERIEDFLNFAIDYHGAATYALSTLVRKLPQVLKEFEEFEAEIGSKIHHGSAQVA